jgi:hypothetical protein
MKSHWWRHGFWNSLEHAITRVLDALVALLLIRAMEPAQFSTIALAQAWASPFLLLFVGPGGMIYRDFAKWKAEGPEILVSRLRALRRYGLLLGIIAVILSAVVAVWIPIETGYHDRFFAQLWSFALLVGLHLPGADREYLRLELEMRTLSGINLYQKVTVFGGTLLVLWLWGARLDLLAAVAVFSMVSTAVLVRGLAARVISHRMGPARGPIPHVSTTQVVMDLLRSFSLWTHICFALNNWVLTLDLFILGLLGLPARVTGLYGASLKLGNLSLAAPFALSNLFSVWLGRRTQEGADEERRQLKKFTVLLIGGTALQALVLMVVTPALMPWFLRGNWSLEDQGQILRWFYWMLAGGVFYSAIPLVNTWLSLRGKAVRLLTHVYLPWTVIAASLYAWACLGSPEDAGTRAAQMNVPVVLSLVILIWTEFRRK